MVETNSSSGSGKSSISIPDLIQHKLNTVTTYQHHMARLLFEIACLDGLGKLAADRSLPMAFRIHLQRVLELFDESLRFALGQLRDAGFTVRCQTGCHYCCYQMPTGVSSPELILIYHGMQQSGVASRFFRRCLEAEELWVEVCHRHARRGTTQNACLPAIEALSKSYGGFEQPCPFLEASLCQIYPFRPLACRMHFSLSPPSWCRPSHFQNPHALRFSLEPGKCVVDALENLEDRFQLRFSDVMICGLLELTVNVMQFDKIRWW
jgi:Fe-S-cluster containining protein